MTPPSNAPLPPEIEIIVVSSIQAFKIKYPIASTIGLDVEYEREIRRLARQIVTILKT